MEDLLDEEAVPQFGLDTPAAPIEQTLGAANEWVGQATQNFNVTMQFTGPNK